MDKHLRIILELVTRGFVGGVRGATSAFDKFTHGMWDGAKNAHHSLMELAKGIFFVREALRTLADAARWVFDTFIKGAGDIAKFEAKLKALSGSAESAEQIMGYLRQTAADTGANFDELAAGAQLLAVAAKDASGAFDFEKFKQMNSQLMRMAAVRPDVPIDRLARGLLAWMRGEMASLEMFLDMPLRQMAGIEDAADELSDIPKEISRGVTYIETEVSKAASDAEANLEALEKALQKMGANQEMLEEMGELSGLERFQQILAQIAESVGKPLFEVMNKELSKLADWLQANPDKVEELATLIGETLAGALEDLFEALEKIDWEQVGADVESFMDALREGDLGKVGDALEQIGKAIQTISQASANFSKFVDDYNRWNTAIFAPERLGEVPGGAELAAAGGLGRTGEMIRQAASAAISAQPGIGAGRLIVEILLKDELLDARVRQTADNAVADGFNIMADEMNSGQQP